MIRPYVYQRDQSFPPPNLERSPRSQTSIPVGYVTISLSMNHTIRLLLAAPRLVSDR